MIKLDKERREQYAKNTLNKLNAKGKNDFRDAFLLLHYSDQAQIFSTIDKEARSRVYTYF